MGHGIYLFSASIEPRKMTVSDGWSVSVKPRTALNYLEAQIVPSSASTALFP